MLRLTKSLWGMGKVVVLDSGFCVLQGIVELVKKGVFASALIKKRRHWPKHILGDVIIRHFEDGNIGDVSAWAGELDNTRFHLHCMKEPDYVMSLMSSYGTTNRIGRVARRVTPNGLVAEFVYPEVVENHYTYRDAVDSHNSARMHPIALEETWKTQRWALRVFQFILAVTEVNVKRAMEYFYGREDTGQIDFRKEFAEALINNEYIKAHGLFGKKRESPRKAPKAHGHFRLEPFTTFKNGAIVKCGTRSIQLSCVDCGHRCNTCCTCSMGTVRCIDCIIHHVEEEVTND